MDYEKYGFLVVKDRPFRYNVKFSLKSGIISVSVPNWGAEVKVQDGILPREIRDEFESIGWSKKGIQKFETYLFKMDWGGKVSIDPITGRMG